MEKITTALIILDGLGESKNRVGNAFKFAKTPVIDMLKKNYPNTLISASGLSVGLPSGVMGNSEVGHLNIGSGRVVYQDLTKIDLSIENGEFFNNEAFIFGIKSAIKNKTAIHLMGLLSDGCVHSSYKHLFALLKMCKMYGAEKVYVHSILDGRDTPPKSAIKYVEILQKEINKIGIGEIVSFCGRYYFMDRDNRYERLEKGYNMLVRGMGEVFSDPINSIIKSYESEVFDEFILPHVKKDYCGLKPNDTIIFYNFRRDRAREITRAIVDNEFVHFKRNFMPINFICMTEYDSTIQSVKIAFNTDKLHNTLGEYIAKLNLKQLRIAETEKYAHVTFFFNGGEEVMYKNESRILIKSKSVPTYDLTPEMSAFEVTEKVVEAIKSKEFDLIVLNFANCDMVGHTGNFDATVKAIEVVDSCLGKVLDTLKSFGGNAVITSDHGNAESMMFLDGSICTSHTTNLVRLYVYDDLYIGQKLLENGSLCDIAPTILKLMDIKKPVEMTGKSLINGIK